jgi:hypothetical protein
MIVLGFQRICALPHFSQARRRNHAQQKKNRPLAIARGPSLGRKRPRRAAIASGYRAQEAQPVTAGGTCPRSEEVFVTGGPPVRGGGGMPQTRWSFQTNERPVAAGYWAIWPKTLGHNAARAGFAALRHSACDNADLGSCPQEYGDIGGPEITFPRPSFRAGLRPTSSTFCNVLRSVE